MKRILIIGHPGAGKSTFAVDLSKITGLPVIHLDSAFWQPGWIQTPKEQWRELVSVLAGRDKWIMDGSYDGTLDIRLPRADTVIFLNYSRWLCLLRVLKRILVSFGEIRPDMADGCPEQIDPEFLKFVWNYRRDRYPIINERLQNYFPDGTLVVLKRPADAARFLNELRSQ